LKGSTNECENVYVSIAIKHWSAKDIIECDWS